MKQAVAELCQAQVQFKLDPDLFFQLKVKQAVAELCQAQVQFKLDSDVLGKEIKRLRQAELELGYAQIV